MPTKLTVTRPADFIEFKKNSILQGIHQRIEEQVRLYPANMALKSEDLTYSYSQLNGHANSVAEAILMRCGKSMAQAALLLPNTSEMIIAMLGALKARKAYVPLDRNYPTDRLRAMFEHAEPSVLLTDDAHQSQAEDLAGNRVPIINISRIARNADASNPEVECDPLDRAYILYTSGTTGRPKGIVFLHRNLLHTTMCLTNELFFSPSDRVTWLHSPSFGSSVMDIYCSLTNGAALFPWDPKVQGFTRMVNWLVNERMTTIQWLPSAFRQFMRTVPEQLQFRDIRIVIMAGEPLTIREVELFRRHFPEGSHLVNQAGTAESYNYYLYRVDHKIPIEDANVAAGYPVSPDRKLLILDDDHNDLPQGSIGEIAIKSNYMSGGYWRDDAQTKTKFVRIGGDEEPTYLTGDLGKIGPDGCLTHLGRKDFQFKIRGCRIEPAEIEYALTRAPGVADCACWFAKNRLEEDTLVGYVVEKSPGGFNQSEAEAYLETKLPSYMVPKIYVLLDIMPSLPNGKADRRSLPNPFRQTEAPARQGTVAPHRVPVAEKIIEIFNDILHLDDVMQETDFLDAGGDSLSAAVLRHCIHETFGVDLPMDSVGDTLTPAHLAELVTATSLNKGRDSLLNTLASAGQGVLGKTSQTAPAACTVSASAAGEHNPHGVHSSGKSGVAERNLIIVGAGQAGREFYTWAVQAIAAGNPTRIKGFLDDRPGALEGYNYEPGVIGSVDTYEIKERDVFVCAIGDPIVKARCSAKIEEKGGLFVNIIHPLANMGLHVKLGVGVVLGPFSSITCDAKVGNHVSIGAFSNVAHDTVLGDWCQISSHCGVNGCATLGDGVFLGSHACIIPGVKVGSWSFVGAGSIVVRDVETKVKVFGNPAVPIGKVTVR